MKRFFGDQEKCVLGFPTGFCKDSSPGEKSLQAVLLVTSFETEYDIPIQDMLFLGENKVFLATFLSFAGGYEIKTGTLGAIPESPFPLVIVNVDPLGMSWDWALPPGV